MQTRVRQLTKGDDEVKGGGASRRGRFFEI